MLYAANPWDNPRILMRQATRTSTPERWIAHRQAWVPMSSHYEYVMLFHSEATRTTWLDEDEAEALKAVVPDMPEEWVLENETLARAPAVSTEEEPQLTEVTITCEGMNPSPNT